MLGVFLSLGIPNQFPQNSRYEHLPISFVNIRNENDLVHIHSQR